MGKDLIPSGGIEPVNLREALEERYLAYALSTIMHRALPDVRDGLKPVHRRVLYAMRLLRLDPGAAFKKCARVVGDVIGKYHPHGDQSVYDALVRLAQDFSQRYPLVDGQGNFGNVDGDNAAAMRYTEARLTEVARLLLDGLDEDAVDFRETYDGTDKEPIVLPGAFPNLLANGSSGIAVGMATSIPPHNAAELCDAAMLLIDRPDATIEDLVDDPMAPTGRPILGPDFPTGGVIMEDAATIREAYRTGRGGFRVRAKWEKQDLDRGTWQVVITEIPYQVQKSRLIEKIAELVQERKLPLIEDIRDESAEDIRIVIVPKSRNVDPALMMEALFRLSELESRIPLNMNVLSRGQVPNVIGLKQVLVEWLDHRREVLIRRSRHRLDEIVRRLELLDGYIIAYLNLDEVIRIIREEDEPKKELIAAFELNEVQADAILNMRLRNLRKLEEMEIRKEHAELSEEKAGIEALLASEAKQWKTVKWQIGEVKKAFGPNTPLGKRRTGFGSASVHQAEDVSQALIEREPITVVLSEKGWIRALKGHIADLSGLQFKAGDKLAISFKAETTDKLMVFSDAGKMYTVGADKLPGGRSTGEPVRLMVDLDEGADVVDVFVHKPDRKLLLMSSDGYGFVTAEADLVANTRKGKQALNLGSGAKAIRVAEADGDQVAMIGENRKFLVFPLSQVPEMTRGKGVRLQRYKDGGVADVRVFTAEKGLTWTDAGGRVFLRTMQDLADWLGDRATAGRLPPTGFPKTNRFGPRGF
ncbi:DNA topoisomerase IV subunit A [Chthonobacter albigriseus]|uniref:DNA topoisomerase IV subunit A n=1 Tax=Chthonobacter albigriseus TaxID=1683161 RepID=UPI0015EE675D|nr:DNA topoisomerase IV subunit A [Chthonobacter albigriseus]